MFGKRGAMSAEISAEIKERQDWRILGETVRGASHDRSGMPNQDAIYLPPETGQIQLPVIMAVADGHGGSKYFRSDQGALLAVNTAASVIGEFLEGQSGVNNLSIIKESAEDWLPKNLVRRWLEEVDAHLADNPISSGDLLDLESKYGTDVRQTAETNPRVTYGATLLIAVIAEEYLLFMQLGDGDILAVSADGKVFRPLPADDRLFGNETTSLCSQNAWRDFRVSFQPVSTDLPPMLLLSTDGYANCFRDEEGFQKVAADIYRMIQTDGIDYVNQNLEEWLVDASKTGSGDDITVGLICNLRLFGKETIAVDSTTGAEKTENASSESSAEIIGAVDKQDIDTTANLSALENEDSLWTSYRASSL